MRRMKAAAKVLGNKRALQHSPHPRTDLGILVAWLTLVKRMLQVSEGNLKTP